MAGFEEVPDRPTACTALFALPHFRGDYGLAFGEIAGTLSASTIVRLKDAWRADSAT